MNCLDPQEAWVSSKSKRGRPLPTFKRSEAYVDLPKMSLPCGKCFLCRERRLKDIALRCVHEAATHQQSCVITNTYNGRHIPADGKLNPKDWSTFMKRLRRQVDHPIRALAVGEYGSKTKRPHIHALIFGMDCLGGAQVIDPDAPNRQYTSVHLDKLWGKGHVRLGEVTSASAAYVAGYALKARDASGEYKETFSYPKKPPLGRGWYDAHLQQMARLGFCTLDGNRVAIPQKYFEWDAEEQNLLAPWRDAKIDFAQNASLGISKDTLRMKAENRAENHRAKRGNKKAASL